MAAVSQSLDLGLATRPAGYLPPSKFRTTIPVHENAATALRKQKIEHRSGGLGSLRTNESLSITTGVAAPVVHKPSNEQIFVERVNLITHWFDLWTVKQRKRFLFEIFEHCGCPELGFVQLYSDSSIASKRKDFTSVLPAFLSKYIFSFLDPKSLCRSAQVSSHWRMLTESDEIWSPKCVKHGWYLHYQPSALENGAWKWHYVSSIKSLVPGREKRNEDGEIMFDELAAATDRTDLFTSTKSISEINTPRTSRRSGSRSRSRSRNRSGSPLSTSRTLSLEDRPRWQHPDKKPRELEWANFSKVTSDGHPDNPKSPTCALLHDSRWGVHSFITNHSYGLGSHDRLDQHPLKQFQFNQHPPHQTHPGTLTQLLQAERTADGSELLKETPMYYPPKEPYENRFGKVELLASERKDFRSRDLRDMTHNYPSHSHPRIVFISSRLPAKELLQDCVMYGVISIVYEYDGTTLDTLIALLTNALKSRQAHSIGFVTDGEPGEIALVRDATVSLATMHRDDIKQFWLDVAMKMTAPDGGLTGSGRHVDVFTPLAACDDGLELLFQLKVLTGVKFTTPINMIGGIRAAMTGDWLEKPENVKPVHHYFKAHQIITWIAVANRIGDALHQTQQVLGHYFSTKRRQLLSEMMAKIVFDALSLGSLKTVVCDVMPIVIEGLVKFQKEKGKLDALQHLAQYLTKRHEAAAAANMTSGCKEVVDGPAADATTSQQLTATAEQDEMIVVDLLCLTKYERERAMKQVSKRENIENQPDRRASVAIELLSSEVDFMRTLSILVDVFMKPLKATLDASKPIIGIGNIHALFTDISAILEISKAVVKEITMKIENWHSETTLADAIIKFCGKSKAYTNYVNNYPIVMRTYDMLIETNPAFRAFIADNEESIRTKMLSFHELYMHPTRRVSEYILLLQALQLNTPPNHSDRTDIPTAISKLEALNKFIFQYKTKLSRDKQMCHLEKRIINCPKLLEGNRYFLREDYVSLLKRESMSNGKKDEESCYRHIQDLTLFLFSDCLAICILKTTHEPFEHVLNRVIIFSSCIALSKLKIDVIKDNKFVRHAIQVSTKKKSSWIFRFSSFEERVTFVHTIENAIRALVSAD